MSSRRWPTPGIFAACFAALLVLHVTLLQLPYFWDEAGYYIPAARDIWLRGSLIPLSTVSNAHPPLVMIWLAAAWKVIGYAPWVTRCAMLAVAAFSLTGLYRLAVKAANPTVAFYTIGLTALYPVFFAQSSLGLVDLAAAGLSFWGIAAYLEGRPGAVAFWFCLAVLAKETALLTPALLGVWEAFGFIGRRWSSAPANTVLLWRRFASQRFWLDRTDGTSRRTSGAPLLAALASPLLPLSLWYAYHFHQTGYVFGNPEFVRYNVTSTLSAMRVTVTLILRLWQAFGYMHLWVLTGAMVIAMFFNPLRDHGYARPRIRVPVLIALCLVIAGYVLAMSAIGGAVLARYMLTAVPLVILVAVSTIWRRLRGWRLVLLAAGLAFVASWEWNPPYGFAPEDNLAYRDFIVLHQDAARYVETHAHDGRVLTAWPATDEIARPSLGYVRRSIPVVKMENFSDAEMNTALALRGSFRLALIFSTKYEPPDSMTLNWLAWERTKAQYFGFHRDVTAPEAAEKLGGRIVFSEERSGLWVAVIALDQVELARVPPPRP